MRHSIAFAIGFVVLIAGCGDFAARRAAIEKAQAQVRRIAENLDKRTTETGVYIRVEEDDIKETDPWGTRLNITYSQGGIAEMVVVRSAGPDRRFQTDDDLTAQGVAANLKGIGEGIKKNAEATAANAAKGAVRGAIEGVKESVKDLNPFGKKNDQAVVAEEENDSQKVVPEIDKADQ